MNVLFVFLTIICESKMSADVINRFFFKNDIQSGSDWNIYHNKDLKLINISIYWHLITFLIKNLDNFQDVKILSCASIQKMSNSTTRPSLGGILIMIFCFVRL